MMDGFRGLSTVEAWIKAFTYQENRCCDEWREEAAPREWAWVERAVGGVSGGRETLEQKHHQLWKRDT